MGDPQDVVEAAHHDPAQSLVDLIGHVSDMELVVSNWQSKFIAIDKQANNDVMHLDRLGKAKGTSLLSPGLREERGFAAVRG